MSRKAKNVKDKFKNSLPFDIYKKREYSTSEKKISQQNENENENENGNLLENEGKNIILIINQNSNK